MQIIVKLTTACNLRCVYCSEGDKTAIYLKEALLQKMIDELPALLEDKGETSVEILWHGGEPLLVGKEYLNKWMQYAQSKLKKYDVRFLMQTNGYLIDSEWVSLFKKFDIGVGISLDGYEELHDVNRRTAQDEPTFQTVMKSIRLMHESGLHASTLMVLNTAVPVDIDKLFSFICTLKESPKIQPVIPCGRADGRQDTDTVYANYVSLLEKLYEKCMEAEQTIVIEPLDELMNAILGVAPVRECSFNGTCGTHFMCLYADGQMGFCGRQGGAENLTYGHLQNHSLLELYHSDNAEKIRQRQGYLMAHDCKNCEDWSLCHGGCGFEAVNATGCLEKPYPRCTIRRQLLQYLKTTGIALLKKRLLKQKLEYRTLIQEREKLLGEIYDERE